MYSHVDFLAWLTLSLPVCKKNTPLEKKTCGKTSLQSTKAGGGEQSLLLDCGAQVPTKGVSSSQIPVSADVPTCFFEGRRLKRHPAPRATHHARALGQKRAHGPFVKRGLIGRRKSLQTSNDLHSPALLNLMLVKKHDKTQHLSIIMTCNTGTSIQKTFA